MDRNAHSLKSLVRRLHVAYVLKRYPRFSETFIVNEILAHEAAGVELSIFALRPPADTHFQPAIARVRAPVTYLHNGSVPTLWHVLHLQERPVVWKRTESGYDPQRVGLEVESLVELPAEATAGWQRREYFDTRGFGKSAKGHEFQSELTADEKRAVLEYLKSL